MNALSPLGTARQRFLVLKGVRPEASVLPFPSELIDAASARDLGEEMLHLAWEAARWADGASIEERRSLLFLTLASLVATRDGSSYVPITSPRLFALLADLGASKSDLAALERFIPRLVADPARARGLIGAPGEVQPLIILSAEGEARLYHQRMLLSEERLVAALRARRATASLDGVQAALQDVLSRPAMRSGKALVLTEDQTIAVRSAIEEPMAVVSGGPGTGKTSIVVAILRVLIRLGVAIEAIALAAPTGKAAKRLEDAIKLGLSAIADPTTQDRLLFETCPTPKTIHRLLGYKPKIERFAHHERHPLPHRVVIVDEGSMIDLALVDRLVRAVHPEARLILLGDADQLPSVDVGAVFRDLVAAPEGSPGRPPVVRLVHSHRMSEDDPAGRAILTCARLMNEGRAQEAGATWIARRSVSEVSFDRVEHLELSRASDRRSLLSRWYKEQVRGSTELAGMIRQIYLVDRGVLPADQRELVERLLDHFERFRILCLTRTSVRPTGADAINEALHRERLRAFEEEEDRRSPFLPGEPVIMERNDYQRELFNGDYGVVLRVAERDRKSDVQLVAAFRSRQGLSVFPLDSLRSDLTLAYAMTVHKAQGSEFDRVALILPDEDIPLLTREVVYTAVTRSRRGVLIVGSKAILTRGIERRIERWSGLSDRLARG
jgi:exodeoxyribonuclease V alpha subunit